MTSSFSVARGLAAFAISVASVAAQAAPIIVNGDFSTGDLTGWSLYTTGNGSLGPVSVGAFDTVSAVLSPAVRLQVGEVSFSGFNEGGGLSQYFFASVAGTYSFSADVAAMGGTLYTNADGGTFSFIVDGSEVASLAMGEIGANAARRGSLSYSGLLAAGTHEIRLQAVRRYLNNDSTPIQYFDNVTVSAPAAAVPEPSVGILALFGVAAVVGRRVVRGRQQA